MIESLYATPGHKKNTTIKAHVYEAERIGETGGWLGTCGGWRERGVLWLAQAYTPSGHAQGLYRIHLIEDLKNLVNSEEFSDLPDIIIHLYLIPLILMGTAVQGVAASKVPPSLAASPLPLKTLNPATSNSHLVDPLLRWSSPPSILPSYTLHKFILTHSYHFSKPSQPITTTLQFTPFAVTVISNLSCMLSILFSFPSRSTICTHFQLLWCNPCLHLWYHMTVVLMFLHC